MKLVKILSVTVVIAAAGIMAAGCDGLAGSGNGGKAVFTEVSAAAPESAGGPLLADAAGLKTINVRFEVKNGGCGLIKSFGVVSTQDDSHLNWGFGELARDFEVRITVPASEKHLNIRWEATDFFWKRTYLKAGLQIGDGGVTYNIVLEYNGRGKVAVKNLQDVSLNTKDVNNDFYNAYKRAGTTEPDGFRKIKVKFEILNGGNGLSKSEGMVSTQDDSYVVYDIDVFANNYTIAIRVPASDEYVNVIWKGQDIFRGVFYARGKMKAESGTVSIDYNYFYVTVKNLYDSETYAPFNEPDAWKNYWEDHKKRSVRN